MLFEFQGHSLKCTFIIDENIAILDIEANLFLKANEDEKIINNPLKYKPHTITLISEIDS